MPDSEPELRFEDEPTPGDVAFLEDRLYEQNVAATGQADGRWLALFVRADDGAIQAGLCGSTWGGCCEIRQVWVHEGLRRRGLGARMLAAAEAEARRRGCTQMVLTTHSFQAPEFYRRYGFEEVSRLDDYPRGHAHIQLRKRLAPRDGHPAE